MSPPAAPRPCPICKAPSAAPFRPFCSKRCADVDLGRWLNGSYVIAGAEEEDEDGAVSAPPSEHRDDEKNRYEN